MTDTYATDTQLAARLSPGYTAPDAPTPLLVKASELVDEVTLGRAQELFDSGTDAQRGELANAVCDQVEFWLEVGEEHDVVGLHGALQGGRVQIQHLPGELGQRARRTLTRLGIYWAGASAT